MHLAEQTYTAWQIAGLVCGGIFATLTAIGSILAGINVVRGWMRDAKADEEEAEAQDEQRFSAGQQAILAQLRETREEVVRQVSDKIAPLEMRIENVEETQRSFRADTQIDRDQARLEGRIDHERANRETVAAQLLRLVEQGQAQMMTFARELARLEARVDGAEASVGKMEAGLDKLGARIEGRLDRFQECLNTLNGRLAA